MTTNRITFETSPEIGKPQCRVLPGENRNEKRASARYHQESSLSETRACECKKPFE